MEIELMAIDKRAKKVPGKVAIKKVIFCNIDFVEPIMEGLCNVSSGGVLFTVSESAESVLSKMRNSVLREASLIVNT